MPPTVRLLDADTILLNLAVLRTSAPKITPLIDAMTFCVEHIDHLIQHAHRDCDHD